MWLKSKPGVGELGWCGFGTGKRVEMGVGGGPLHTTSGSSVCGQGGCQTLGLWIAEECGEEEDE